MTIPGLTASFDQVEASSSRELAAMTGAWRKAAASTSDVMATAQLTKVILRLPSAQVTTLLAFAVRQLAAAPEQEEVAT